MRSFLNFYQNLDIQEKTRWNSHRIGNWPVQECPVGQFWSILGQKIGHPLD